MPRVKISEQYWLAISDRQAAEIKRIRKLCSGDLFLSEIDYGQESLMCPAAPSDGEEQQTTFLPATDAEASVQSGGVVELVDDGDQPSATEEQNRKPASHKDRSTKIRRRAGRGGRPPVFPLAQNALARLVMESALRATSQGDNPTTAASAAEIIRRLTVGSVRKVLIKTVWQQFNGRKEPKPTDGWLRGVGRVLSHQWVVYGLDGSPQLHPVNASTKSKRGYVITDKAREQLRAVVAIPADVDGVLTNDG